MKTFSIVVATDKNGGIGKNNRLPWQGKLKTDMAFFKELTTSTHQYNIINNFFKSATTQNLIYNPHGLKNVVIMGRKTWESIPKKFKPLEDRLNIVLSRTIKQIEGAICFESLEDALASLMSNPPVGEIFVIGGAQLYAEALRHVLCKIVYITSIDQEFECDTFLDLSSLNSFLTLITSPEVEENNITYKFKALVKNEHISETV